MLRLRPNPSGNMEYVIRLVYFASALWMSTKLGNVNAAHASDAESYCFAQDTNPYRNFGTSTSYSHITGPSPHTKMLVHNGCKPVHVYGLMRVGARYYTRYNAENLRNLQRQILQNHDPSNKRGKLCPDDLAQLKSWISLGEGKTSSDLAPQGKVESSTLGSRLSKKFNEFGDVNSNNFNFFINSDKTSRDSAAAFIEGMFGASTHANVSMKDDTLQFIENSNKLEEKLTKRAFTIRDTCVNSKQMKTLMKEVSGRLGFANVLTESSIEDMYFSCAFETAWNPSEKAGFCTAFTKSHLQLLEYCYMDILGYYEWGYGTSYGLKVQNPILEDLLSRMSAAARSKDEHLKGDFNFASAAALTHTIMKLGLFRDRQPLLASNYGPRQQERKWSMTRISPFNGNLITVLHKCGGNEHKVSVYHNENPITIPGCSSALCPLPQFQNVIRSSNNQSSKLSRGNLGQVKQPKQLLRQAKAARSAKQTKKN